MMSPGHSDPFLLLCNKKIYYVCKTAFLSPQELLDMLGLGTIRIIARLSEADTEEQDLAADTEEQEDLETSTVEQNTETDTMEQDMETDTMEQDGDSSSSHCGGITSSESENEDDEETYGREGGGESIDVLIPPL